jgi:maleylpyruvate isomerase
MKLYSYWRSSSAWRVRIALNLKQIAYECICVNLAPDVREQLLPEYARVNPLQQVPTLEWEADGQPVRITQSVAIVEYLEERYPEPALLPAAALTRARVREAVEIVNSGIQPLQNTRTLTELRQVAGEAALQPWARQAIAHGLRGLEAHASAHAGRCLVGDSLSLADVYLVPQLYNARRYGVDVGQFPRLLAAESHVSQLAAFLRARPEAQPDAVTT